MSAPRGLTEPQVLTVARGLLAELSRVHDAGGVSGAVGPGTVLVDESGGVRLVEGPVDHAYASPEVLAGQPPTVQSDLYSAGAVLAHLFRGEPTVPPSVAGLDAGIAWLLGPVLAAQPEARPGSAAAMVAAVDQLAEQRHGPEWRVAAGFVAATGVAGGVPILVLATGGTASAAGAVGAAGGAAGVTGVAGVAGAAGSAGAVGGAGATGVGAGAAAGAGGGAGASGAAGGTAALGSAGASGQVAAAGGVVAPQGGLLGAGAAAPGAGAPAAAGGASASGAAGTGQGVVGTSGAQAAGHSSHAAGAGLSKGLAIKVGAVVAAGAVGVAGVAAAVILLGGGETHSVDVPGTADIYLAGADEDVTAQLSDPGTAPVEVDVDGAGSVKFGAVSGEVAACAGCEPESPDGGDLSFAVTGVTAFNGIAGVAHDNKTLFLVGVFVGDDQPDQPADAVVDLTDGNDDATQSPDLGEPFFVGDGETSDGEPQEIEVPDGATTMYLGFADSFSFVGAPGAYGDNQGTLSFDVEID